MLPPLRFLPLIKQRRWGGTRLGTHLRKPIGTIKDAAESWEVVDHGIDQSLVASGPYEGWSLSQLIRKFPEDMLGEHSKQTTFPLLVKFLDADDRLSLQVHPNDLQAWKFAHEQTGKTEAWVILNALPDSVIYAGLKVGTTPENLAAAIATGTVESLVHKFRANAGDCLLIPPGTVHAIGEGVMLVEVQTSSDITFRLHDWGRTDTDGNLRPLHIPQALECINYSQAPILPLKNTNAAGEITEQAITCEHFEVWRYRGLTPWSLELPGRFQILMVLEGEGELTWSGGTERLSPGDTILIPASCLNAKFQPSRASYALQLRPGSDANRSASSLVTCQDSCSSSKK